MVNGNKQFRAVKFREMMRVFKELGFDEAERNTKITLRHGDGRAIKVNNHAGNTDINRHVLRKLLREGNIVEDKFVERL